MDPGMFFEKNQEQSTRRQMAQFHYYHNYYPQPTQSHAYYPPTGSVVIDSSEAANKYNGFVVCEHKRRAPAPTKPQARAQAPQLVHQPRVVNHQAGPKPLSSNHMVSYDVINQDTKPRQMMPRMMMSGSNSVVPGKKVLAVGHFDNKTNIEVDVDGKADKFIAGFKSRLLGHDD